MITLNPLVIAHARCDEPAVTSSHDSSPSIAYSVTDSLDYGLWKGKTTYRAEFCDLEDGLKTKAIAAMGVVSESVWTVEDGTDGSLVLAETATVTCPRMLRMFIEGTIKKSHDELGRRFAEKLAGETKVPTHEDSVVS
ncbi:hypothetical protein C8Q76DRAFT_412292 [Earliella scabrosa]|nr:hypothetical protein C8Q76DRAFT_412292 [Earliella scabrosa]